MKITEVIVYKYDERDKKFCMEKLRDFDIPNTCCQFSFLVEDDETLLFFTKKDLFKFFYQDETKDIEYIYTLKEENQLKYPPKNGVFSDDQKYCMITSLWKCIFVDYENDIEVNVGENEGISAIQKVIYHERRFYILANKYEGKLGFYLMSINIDRPDDECDFIINWDNKLDIGDVDMNILREKDANGNDYENECIVASFKCIGINTYNVCVIDLERK